MDKQKGIKNDKNIKERRKENRTNGIQKKTTREGQHT